MCALLSKLRRRTKGFTLIELIVVMAIIAILAMIAVPRLAQFREMAEQRRKEANERIVTGAVAMEVAKLGNPSLWSGLTVPILWSATSMQTGPNLTDNSGKLWDDCFSWGRYFKEWPQGGMTASIDGEGEVTFDHTGGSGVVTPVFTASFVNTPANVTGASATVSATAGNLLVAVASQRSFNSDAGPGTPSAPGWTFRGVSSFKTVGSTGDRRAVAVFTRTATGTSADNLAVTWTDGGVLHVSVQQFNVSAAPVTFNFVATNGTASTVTTLALAGSSAGVLNNNSLLIAGVTMRADSDPGTISWASVGNAITNANGNMRTSMGSAQVNGVGPHTATPSWPTATWASGFVLLIRP